MNTKIQHYILSFGFLSVALLGIGGLIMFQQAYADGAIEPGFDLFKTDAGATSFSLPPIPAGFFGPGCEPFSGTVRFGGNPVNMFNGKDTGNTDTAVHRINQLNLPGPGSSASVPIEIVALSLASSSPISVRCGTTTTSWNVSIKLSDAPQQPGTMTIQQTGPTGGTFNSSLPVVPKFIFTPAGGGTSLIFDAGHTITGPTTSQNTYLFQSSGPWLLGTACPPGILRVTYLTSNFCASANTSGTVKTTATSGGTVGTATHAYQPSSVGIRLSKDAVGGSGKFHFTGTKNPVNAPSSFFDVFFTVDQTNNFHADSFFDISYDLNNTANNTYRVQEQPQDGWLPMQPCTAVTTPGSIQTCAFKNVKNVPFVDLQINGSDNPAPVVLGTPVFITWPSFGVGYCNTGVSPAYPMGWGSYNFAAIGQGATFIPTVAGTLRFGIQCALSASSPMMVEDWVALIAKNPTIAITTPNGGETLTQGQTYNITWTQNVLPGVDEKLIAINYASATPVVTTITTVSSSWPQSYAWKVPANLFGSKFKVAIIYDARWKSGGYVEDLSDNYFSIVAP